MGAGFTAEWVLDAVNHVLIYLFTRPLRLNRRLEFNAGVAMVTGLENILACCKQDAEGVTPEQWALEDASLGGICAAIPEGGRTE